MAHSSRRSTLGAAQAADERTGPRFQLGAFGRLQVLFWGAFLAVRALAAARYYPEWFWPYMAPRAGLVLAYAALTTAIHLTVNRFPSWTPTQRLWLTLPLCALALYPMQLLEHLVVRIYTAEWPSAIFLDYLSQYGWVMLAWAGYHFAHDHAREVRRQAVRLTRAQAAAHAAQMKMLRYQINPHFLFNSLNAISALVLERRNEDAESMLLRLSRFLRSTLDSDPIDLARLGDELKLLRLYLDMEAARFGEKLRVRYDVPDALLDCLTPSLVLQPIVENAIKHGVAPSPHVGQVEISAREVDGRLQLVVENDGAPFAPAPKADGLGLRNTHERLAAAYGDDARLTMASRLEGGARALIDLPLRR